MTDRSDKAGGDGLREPFERLLAAFKGLMPFPLVVQAVAEGLVRDAEAALAASPPSGNAGEGAQAKWRLLPSEPTEAMIEAGVKDHRHEQSYAGAEETYLAMVAAAPAPPQPAPDAAREALDDLQSHYSAWRQIMESAQVHSARCNDRDDASYLKHEINVLDRVVAALSAPVQQGGTEAPAQSSPCLRYVNDGAELVCKCVNGKYPEVVDMEWRPPTCLGTVQK